MLLAVTFVENNGGTTLTLRSHAIQATERERQTLREGHASMRGGFGGTFEQLVRHLAAE